MLLVAFGLLLFACPDKFIFTNFQGVPRLVQNRTKEMRIEKAREDARAGRLLMYGMRVTECKNVNKLKLVSNWSRKPIAPRVDITLDKYKKGRECGTGKAFLGRKVKTYKKVYVQDQLKKARPVVAVKHPWLERFSFVLVILGILEDTCWDTFPDAEDLTQPREKKESTSMGGGMKLKGIWTLKGSFKKWVRNIKAFPKKHSRELAVMVGLALASYAAFGFPLIMPLAAINSNGAGGGNWSAGASWNGGLDPRTTDDATLEGRWY